MSTLLLVIACFSAAAQPTFCFALEDEPLVTVETAAEAANLNADSQRVKVVMRDYATLETVFKRAPHLRWLEIHHPGHKMPLKSFKLLAKFKNLEQVYFSGDPFMSDEKFAELGKLHRLKTLNISLP